MQDSVGERRLDQSGNRGGFFFIRLGLAASPGTPDSLPYSERHLAGFDRCSGVSGSTIGEIFSLARLMRKLTSTATYLMQDDPFEAPLEPQGSPPDAEDSQECARRRECAGPPDPSRHNFP